MPSLAPFPLTIMDLRRNWGSYGAPKTSRRISNRSRITSITQVGHVGIYKASWCICASGHTMRTGPPLSAMPHPPTSSAEHPRKALPHLHPSSQPPHLPVHSSPSRSRVPVSVSSPGNSSTRNCVSVFEPVERRQQAGSRTTTPRSSVGPYRNVSLPQAL